jgi:class I fructose-bisphosphate aldolase
MLKINHNELLTFPTSFDQIMFGSIQQAYDMGCAAVGATIYFGSDDSGPPDR